MNETQEGFDKARRELVHAGHNLWLAGLGAVAEVSEEGRSLFDRLVERGKPLEKRQRKVFEKVGDRTQDAVRELGKLAEDTAGFETRKALQRFGLLTRDDLKVLAVRLDTLSQKIDEIESRQDIAIEIPLEPATDAATKARRPRQRKA